MSVISVPQSIKPGDRVRVKCSGAQREGVVHSAYPDRIYHNNEKRWEVIGWDLEFDDPNYGAVNWKQSMDGGSVTVL